MPEKLVYEYASIRYVPRVERGEFLNVGVVLFCKRKKFLQLKYHLDENRLRALCRNVDLEELKCHLQAWDLVCQGDARGGKIAQLDQAYRFRWVTAPKSTIIQCSAVHPGLCDEPEKELDDLFKKLVLL